MILSAWDDGDTRDALGRVLLLARQSWHDLEVKAARNRYEIQTDAVWGMGTTLSGEGTISIQSNSYIGEACMIVAHPVNATVRIGRDCAISHNVQIRTEGYRTDVPFEIAREVDGVSKDIIIEDSVWIGANVFICGGVTIGKDSVVGANSVVTKDVPANAIVGGVPARVLRFKEGSRSMGSETLT